jgi:hypothetical protein
MREQLLVGTKAVASHGLSALPPNTNTFAIPHGAFAERLHAILINKNKNKIQHIIGHSLLL